MDRPADISRANARFVPKVYNYGDAIKALFPAPIDKAVPSMLGMMDSKEGYNASLHSTGRPELHSEAAIHTVHLILSIFGEAERYEGTVIAETVEPASRLEGLTKYYGVRAHLQKRSRRYAR